MKGFEVGGFCQFRRFPIAGDGPFREQCRFVQRGGDQDGRDDDDAGGGGDPAARGGDGGRGFP